MSHKYEFNFNHLPQVVTVTVDADSSGDLREPIAMSDLANHLDMVTSPDVIILGAAAFSDSKRNPSLPILYLGFYRVLVWWMRTGASGVHSTELTGTKLWVVPPPENK